MPFSQHPIREEVVARLKRDSHINKVFRLTARDLYIKATKSTYERVPERQYADTNETAVAVLAHGLLLRDLVKLGIYHPKTTVLLGQDKTGKPELLVTMPDLGPGIIAGKDYAHFVTEHNDKVEKMKRHFNLQEKDLDVDVGQVHNWRKSGETWHYIDLEVLKPNPDTEKLLEQYRTRARKLLRKKTAQ